MRRGQVNIKYERFYVVLVQVKYNDSISTVVLNLVKYDIFFVQQYNL